MDFGFELSGGQQGDRSIAWWQRIDREFGGVWQELRAGRRRAEQTHAVANGIVHLMDVSPKNSSHVCVPIQYGPQICCVLQTHII